jgi:hypothetical protein
MSLCVRVVVSSSDVNAPRCVGSWRAACYAGASADDRVVASDVSKRRRRQPAAPIGVFMFVCVCVHV